MSRSKSDSHSCRGPPWFISLADVQGVCR